MFNMVVGHWLFVFYVCDEIFLKKAESWTFYQATSKITRTKALFTKESKRNFGVNSK